MKLGFQFVLLLLATSSVFAAIPRPTADARITTCLKQSLKLKSPPERDLTRLKCLEKYSNVSLNTCLSEAKKMEYLTYSQEAIKNCYYLRPTQWNALNCLNVAKKLHTLVDRDSMRLDCMSQYSAAGGSKGDCKMISNSFEQLHYREHFKQVCAE